MKLAAVAITVAAKNPIDVKIEASWKARLESEFGKEYFKLLVEFVRDAYASGTVYPPPKEIFNAFEHCTFDEVKVVILGQDPYHGSKQANGLAFSVAEGVRVPPSLQNIYKEIVSDIGRKSVIDDFGIGDLTHWSKQGVLLLNATLTVEAGKPGSHQDKGWEVFTDAVVDVINREKEHVVFILWGAYAGKKGATIDRGKHLVIESPHPSPFSANRGFFGSKPFSKANEYLKKYGKDEIEW